MYYNIITRKQNTLKELRFLTLFKCQSFTKIKRFQNIYILT